MTGLGVSRPGQAAAGRADPSSACRRVGGSRGPHGRSQGPAGGHASRLRRHRAHRGHPGTRKPRASRRLRAAGLWGAGGGDLALDPSSDRCCDSRGSPGVLGPSHPHVQWASRRPVFGGARGRAVSGVAAPPAPRPPLRPARLLPTFCAAGISGNSQACVLPGARTPGPRASVGARMRLCPRSGALCTPASPPPRPSRSRGGGWRLPVPCRCPLLPPSVHRPPIPSSSLCPSIPHPPALFLACPHTRPSSLPPSLIPALMSLPLSILPSSPSSTLLRSLSPSSSLYPSNPLFIRPPVRPPAHPPLPPLPRSSPPISPCAQPPPPSIYESTCPPSHLTLAAAPPPPPDADRASSAFQALDWDLGL